MIFVLLPLANFTKYQARISDASLFARGDAAGEGDRTAAEQGLRSFRDPALCRTAEENKTVGHGTTVVIPHVGDAHFDVSRIVATWKFPYRNLFLNLPAVTLLRVQWLDRSVAIERLEQIGTVISAFLLSPQASSFLNKAVRRLDVWNELILFRSQD